MTPGAMMLMVTSGDVIGLSLWLKPAAQQEGRAHGVLGAQLVRR